MIVATVIEALLERSGIAPETIDEVLLVARHGIGYGHVMAKRLQGSGIA